MARYAQTLETRAGNVSLGAVVSYRPPEAKHVRYGGKNDDVQIVWRQHVQEHQLFDDFNRLQNDKAGFGWPWETGSDLMAPSDC